MNAVNSWEHRGIDKHNCGAWVFREEAQAHLSFPLARVAAYGGETAWLQESICASKQHDSHLMEWQDKDAVLCLPMTWKDSGHLWVKWANPSSTKEISSMHEHLIE